MIWRHFFKSSSHYSHRITDHLTAQGSWALRVLEICLWSNCFGIIGQNQPFPSRKAMRLLWHMCTVTVNQFNKLIVWMKGHQYEGNQISEENVQNQIQSEMWIHWGGRLPRGIRWNLRNLEKKEKISIPRMCTRNKTSNIIYKIGNIIINGIW